MILLNLIWPAVYVEEGLWKFWFLVFGTIAIETFAIKAILNYDWRRSFLVSVSGNIISATIGAFVMMLAMLGWHAAVDGFLPHATFDRFNWVATFVWMCLGSALIETWAIKIIFKDTLKRLFLPLLIGNLLTYAFIAYVWHTADKAGSDRHKTSTILYQSVPSTFHLLDDSKLNIYSASIELREYEEGDTTRRHCSLYIRFHQEPESFQFELKRLGAEFSGGIEASCKRISLDSLQDTVLVLLEQKNPDTDLGWTAPITTDTIKFIRRTPIN